tara:strand:+ start:1493 stop:1816 length:324 start_codon:yes stop_codon:yes gene_type:complete
MNKLKTYLVQMLGYVNHTERVEATSKEDAFDKAWKQVQEVNTKSDIFVDFSPEWSPDDIEEIDLEQEAKDDAIRMFVCAKHKQLGHDRYCDIQDKVNKVLNELWEIK